MSDRVIIHSINRNLNIRLNAPISLGQSTLRRQRTMPPTVFVALGHPFDVATALNISVEAALRAVNTSPDIERYRRAGFLRVVRPGDPPPAPEPKWEPISRAAAPDEPIEEPPQPPAPPVEEPPEPEAARAGAIEVPALSPLPPPTIPSEEVDLMPSMRWSKEDLLVYAKRHQLDVHDEMTKAAIIRRIRTNE